MADMISSKQHRYVDLKRVSLSEIYPRTARYLLDIHIKAEHFLSRTLDLYIYNGCYLIIKLAMRSPGIAAISNENVTLILPLIFKTLQVK